MKRVRHFICWFTAGHKFAHIYKGSITIDKWCINCGKYFIRS